MVLAKECLGRAGHLTRGHLPSAITTGAAVSGGVVGWEEPGKDEVVPGREEL